jgi:hypothetical protein
LFGVYSAQSVSVQATSHFWQKKIHAASGPNGVWFFRAVLSHRAGSGHFPASASTTYFAPTGLSTKIPPRLPPGRQCVHARPCAVWQTLLLAFVVHTAGDTTGFVTQAPGCKPTAAHQLALCCSGRRRNGERHVTPKNWWPEPRLHFLAAPRSPPVGRQSGARRYTRNSESADTVVAGDGKRNPVLVRPNRHQTKTNSAFIKPWAGGFV